MIIWVSLLYMISLTRSLALLPPLFLSFSPLSLYIYIFVSLSFFLSSTFSNWNLSGGAEKKGRCLPWTCNFCGRWCTEWRGFGCVSTHSNWAQFPAIPGNCPCVFFCFIVFFSPYYTLSVFFFVVGLRGLRRVLSWDENLRTRPI
jgi:hypothetical protein